MKIEAKSQGWATLHGARLRGKFEDYATAEWTTFCSSTHQSGSIEFTFSIPQQAGIGIFAIPDAAAIDVVEPRSSLVRTTRGPVIRMSPNCSDWFPTMTALYHVIVHCATPLGCRYGTLVDLDGKRCEWLGVLELSMEVPGAHAAKRRRG